MLGKFVILMFVGVVSMAPTMSLAAGDTGNVPIANALDSMTLAANATNIDLSLQAEASNDSETQDASNDSGTQGVAAQNTGTNETTLPATGWWLVLALIGFVMLSNRHGV